MLRSMYEYASIRDICSHLNLNGFNMNIAQLLIICQANFPHKVEMYLMWLLNKLEMYYAHLNVFNAY